MGGRGAKWYCCPSRKQHCHLLSARGGVSGYGHRTQQDSGPLGRAWAGRCRWVGGRLMGPICWAPSGGRSHDLLSGLPTCCLLRRPLPGVAPGSGCLGLWPTLDWGGPLTSNLTLAPRKVSQLCHLGLAARPWAHLAVLASFFQKRGEDKYCPWLM